MIDRTVEPLMTIAAAAASLPGRGGRATASYGTVWRWATRGIKAGPRLETIRRGGAPRAGQTGSPDR